MTTFRLALASLMALSLCLPLLPAQAQATAPGAAVAPAQGKKVLKYAFRVAETSFDPAQITDLYSRTVANGFFEAPYEFEFMAKPARMRNHAVIDRQPV